MALQVDVVSPERVTYSGQAEMVICRTVGGGDIAFQAGHVPFVGILQVWEAKVVGTDTDETFAVHSGFVQVARDQVTILSDVSEHRDDIDVERAQAARERAQAALEADGADSEAGAAAQRAAVRLAVAAGTSPIDH
ncbi:MAG: ATP synthase F1 subunit epsilon [Acidimicrobiia bacterium]|nr:ATP synthase F1 subunit epsilon [Acidimicrobiia bacterium]